MTYQCYEDIIGQASAWKASIQTVDEQASEIADFFAEPIDELVFTACGSPYYLGLSAARLWAEEVGSRATAAPASEIMLFPEAVLPAGGSPVLVGISRSGESTETVKAAKAFAKKFPARTVLFGCREDSTLDRLADLSIVIPEAHDDVVPQTKSFSSMYLAAQYAAALVAGDDDLAAALRELPEELPSLLSQYEPILKRIGEADWETAVFLGGGPLYGVAAEAALKLTEMSLTHAVSYHTLEVRHGPRSVIDDKTLVVSLGSRRGEPHEQHVITDLLEGSTPHILALTPDNGWKLDGVGHEIPVGGRLPDHAVGLQYLPLLQLLAYYRAMHKGLDPDTSRNLSHHVQLPGVEGGT